MGLYERLRYAKAPLVFFGGGFRRERRRLSDEHRQRMEKLIHRAKLVGVRGYATQQFFVHNGIENLEVIGDPVWAFEPVPVPDFPPGFNIGIIVRNMGKTGEPQYVENRHIHEIIAKVTDYLVERFDAKPYFFSFGENVHDSDSEGARETIALMKDAGKVELIPMGEDQTAVGSMIGRIDYLVSQRLHPTVLAWIQGKPCVAFEYQFGKTTDCMNSIGMDEFVIRTDEFSLANYRVKFDRLWSERPLIANHAERSIAYWRRKLQDFARRTLDILGR
jgi:polysaccharide pyruvyl transferase WcaK-like protein